MRAATAAPDPPDEPPDGPEETQDSAEPDVQEEPDEFDYGPERFREPVKLRRSSRIRRPAYHLSYAKLGGDTTTRQVSTVSSL